MSREEELFDLTVKGKFDPMSRLQRQLERVNVIASSGDDVMLENAIQVLYSELPINIKQAVDAREDEYRAVEEKLVFNFFAGLPINNPKLGSPRKVAEEYIDWLKLLEVIKEELEKANLTWEYREEARLDE